MSKRDLDVVGRLAVGCIVRVTKHDRPAAIEGMVTRLRQCDGGVQMSFKSSEDEKEHTQHVAVAVLGPILHNHWVGYDIQVLKPAPHQHGFAGMARKSS